MPERDQIGVAHKIATQLWDAGYREAEGCAVLAMALGIYCEAHEDSHRELRALVEGMTEAAQVAFDALRAARGAKASHA